jgi:hypothetical protein
MAKYRKKPVVIEAFQWLGDNWNEIADFCYEKRSEIYKMPGGYKAERLLIHTLEGDMMADIGDYIIKGIRGEFYPCKPDIFEATYERVDAE